MLEAEILREIRLYLGKRPEILPLRINTMMAFVHGRAVRSAPKGTADLLCCYRGRFLALEVKAPDGRQSPRQRAFEAAVRRTGGLYFIVRCVSDVVLAMESIDAAA